jgi:hypothetical protein
MAVNQKPVFATGYVSHGRKLFRPGERIDDKLPEHALKGALEGGVASDVNTRAEQAKKAEGERRAGVKSQIESRSEKREHNARRDGSVKQLVKLPDGTYAEAS